MKGNIFRETEKGDCRKCLRVRLHGNLSRMWDYSCTLAEKRWKWRWKFGRMWLFFLTGNLQLQLFSSKLIWVHEAFFLTVVVLDYIFWLFCQPFFRWDKMFSQQATLYVMLPMSKAVEYIHHAAIQKTWSPACCQPEWHE